MIQTKDPDRRAVGLWLLGVALLVVLMVMVGGATRLTGSGLSMTDWKPLSGTIPPISIEAWQAEFANYQQSPEYIHKNAGMTLDAFKSIFYWEWGHRVLGRLIGLAFGLPLLFFWMRGRIPMGYKPVLTLLFVLGGAQGLLGWYMVMSGLVDVPEVSHFRLAAHLSLALTLLVSLIWVAMRLLRPFPVGGSYKTRRLTMVALGLLALQIVLGAFVAGLDAGLAASDWPLMHGQVIPAGLFEFEPWLSNFVSNPLTVQFEHRMLAYGLTALLVGLYIVGRREKPAVRRRLNWVLLFLLIQVLLGVFTIVLQVPVVLGVLHQLFGVLLLASLVMVLHECRRSSAYF